MSKREATLQFMKYQRKQSNSPLAEKNIEDFIKHPGMIF